MSQFIVKKKKTINEKENKNIIILQNINIANLDKEYAMKEIKENTTKKFIKNLSLSETCNLGSSPSNLGSDPNKDTELKKKNDEPNRTGSEVIKSLTEINLFQTTNITDKSSFLLKKTKKKETLEQDPKLQENNKNLTELKSVTTKLEHLGISNEQRNCLYQPLIKNDSINVRLYTSLSNKDEKKQIPSKTNLYCWWCKYQIPNDVHPIGCPIKYFKKDVSKNILEDYFETDGIFCSFNCILAYINDVNVYDIRYRESGGLLYILYKKIFNEFPPNMCIKPALNWRLLKNFGGIISIDEFRNSFQKINNLSLNYTKDNSSFTKKDILLQGPGLKQNSVSYIEETTKESLSKYNFN
jgi:hypothetical protein